MDSHREAVAKGMRGEATDRQLEALDVIRSHMRRTGMPPTVREIGREMGIASPNGVAGHLRQLEHKGMIRRLGKGNFSRGWLPVVAAGCCPCCERPMEEEQ